MGVPLASSFARFLLAGSVGFLVDAGVLTALMRYAGWAPSAARLVSFSTAVLTTWLINRTFTYSERRGFTPAAELTGYVAIQAVGAAINLGVFMLCIHLWPQLKSYPVLPLAAGAAPALLFNFTVARGVLYSARNSTPPGQPL